MSLFGLLRAIEKEKAVKSFFLALLLAFLPSVAAKSTLVLKLKQPLRAEEIKVRIPSATNAKGERRDLETVLALGPSPQKQQSQAGAAQTEDLSLSLTARLFGKNSVLIAFALPNAGYVEILMLDSYGKTFATATSGYFPKGRHMLPTLPYPESEQNGVRFLALKVDGKVVKKKMLPRVK